MDTKQVIARFEAERQALALMDHPNIARFFDAGVVDDEISNLRTQITWGRPYFVMELAAGMKITDYCDQKRFSTRQRLGLFAHVCRAVQHAHQKGVIHRDLKPSNILVAEQEGEPVPKVIDFGIAKATTGQQLTDLTLFTAFEQFVGTPAYMSPEQAGLGRLDIDTRSDIYSLGVLLYELLTGRTPFDTNELRQSGLESIRRTIRETEPPRPSSRLRALEREELATTARCHGTEAPKLIGLLRGDLDWIVMKCLEKDRRRRYETVNGLARDIERHLSCEPVFARPPSKLYEIQRTMRRHKLSFAAAGAVIGALAIGATVSTLLYIRESKARALAVAAQRSAQRLLYDANLDLAQQAWEHNDVGRVRELLKETATSPERGFEWYYWQRLVRLALRTLYGHTDEITSVAFFPDGRRIVTGSADLTAKVWDALTGKELLSLRGHAGRIESVGVSPDGQRIVTGSADQTARVWDAARGGQVLMLRGHSSSVSSVAFSADGRRILTGSADQTARLWDAASGQQLLRLKRNAAPINSVALSPDGHQIVTGANDRTATVWDVASGSEWLALKGHDEAINCVAFSPDGRRIVTGSDDGTAKVWDAASGEKVVTFRGHGAPVFSAAFSPDAKRVVTCGKDCTAVVWDPADGRELLTLKGHQGLIMSVAFSPNGAWIVTGSYDNTAKVWDAAENPGALTLSAGDGPVRALAFSPDGQRMVTAGWDGTARVLEAASGHELVTFRGHRGGLTSVSLSPDGSRILTGSTDQSADLWDAATGQNLRTFHSRGDWVRATAFSPDGQRVVVTDGYDGAAKVWDAASGRELLTLKGHDLRINSVAFSPAGARIVTGSEDRTAKVWDAATGLEQHTLRGHEALITSVGFSPNGRWVITGSADRTAKLWDAASGACLLTFRRHGDQITAVAFSPDGERVATASWDGTVKVWDAANARQLLTLQGFNDLAWTVGFSPDGLRLAAGGEDHTVRLWPTPSPRQVLRWEQEEQGLRQQVASLQHEQAELARRYSVPPEANLGAIKDWLVLTPLALPGRSHAAALAALAQDQIPGEAQLRPRAGDRVEAAGGQGAWRAVQTPRSVLDFGLLAGKPTSWSVAYALCYIWSEAKQTGLVMQVSDEPGAMVYLNAKTIYQWAAEWGYAADSHPAAGIELEAGCNVLLFKVLNETGHCTGWVHFADASGQPVKGIRVTLTPP